MTRQFSALVLAAAFAAAALHAQQTPAPAAAQPASVPTAQQPAAQPADQPADVGAYTIRLPVNEVNLIFTVTDKHGHYIPDLRQSDFALLDDGRAPARVNSFHQQINLPLRVGLVVDASTSIRSRFQFEQQSATEFLLQILKSKSDRAFVFGLLALLLGLGVPGGRWLFYVQLLLIALLGLTIVNRARRALLAKS